MTQPNAVAIAYELFDTFLAGLEEEEMRRFFRARAGVDATEDEIDQIDSEWVALRRHVDRKRRAAIKGGQR